MYQYDTHEVEYLGVLTPKRKVVYMNSLFCRQSVKSANAYEEKYYRKIASTQSTIVNLLLDSNIIIQSNVKMFNAKLVKCGNYYRVSFLNNYSTYSDKMYEKTYYVKKHDHNFSLKHNTEELPKLKEISKNNLYRTRNSLTDLIKANEDIFKTFITLTFDTKRNTIDVNDITECNSKFNIWKTYIKQLFPDFKYVAVPEFQKRGAVHYHLLTNISYDSDLLTIERKIWSPKKKVNKIGKDVKGWKYGHNMAIDITAFNVIGYLTKYLQKDVDNRLFGQRKYFHSRNLNKPETYYLDLNDLRYREFEELFKASNMKIVYDTYYYQEYSDNLIHCVEFLEENC